MSFETTSNPETTSSFEGRFLSKLSKIDKQDIENFLTHLVREKNFLEIIFNAMLDGMIVLRPSLEVIYTNNAALDLLGINPRRRIIGSRISEVCEQRDFCDAIARFAVSRNLMTNVEFDSLTNPPRVLSGSIIPLEADRGNAAGSVIIVVHDVTQARAMEEQRRRADRATTMTTLAAGLAHEIKNPLNSLQIHAQLMQQAIGAGKGKRKVDMARLEQSSNIIVEEIQRLSQVVETFLSAVRPTRPLCERVNINSIVERVAATVRPEIDQSRIRFDVALEHDIPAVEVDPNQMTQALLNLLRNAMEALGQSQDPRIELRTALAPDGFGIRVSDNGPGMSEEQLGKIFEPYYTTKFSGTGLGLSIVSRIVEEHGGHMNVDSQPGHGTSVTLSFPLKARPVRLLGSSGPPPIQSVF